MASTRLTLASPLVKLFTLGACSSSPTVSADYAFSPKEMTQASCSWEWLTAGHCHCIPFSRTLPTRATQPLAGGRGGGSDLPISRECNVPTSTIPITTMPPLEGTPMPLTAMTVLLRIVVPQLDTGLPPEQQPAYQEEQQVRARAPQVDTERRAMQRRGELTSVRVTIEA
jgi:hypothetical protein